MIKGARPGGPVRLLNGKNCRMRQEKKLRQRIEAQGEVKATERERARKQAI
jgi:hypothetical protein